LIADSCFISIDTVNGQKLSLNKTTISNLTATQMDKIAGGNINLIHQTKMARPVRDTIPVLLAAAQLSGAHVD